MLAGYGEVEEGDRAALYSVFLARLELGRVFRKKKVVLEGEFGKMSNLSNQMLGQKGMTFTGGVLKMKDAHESGTRGESSTGSTEVTLELVKEISFQNEMMQKMVTSVTTLCATLQESNKRVEKKLEKAEAKLEQIPEVKESSPESSTEKEEEDAPSEEEKASDDDDAEEDDVEESPGDNKYDGPDNQFGAE